MSTMIRIGRVDKRGLAVIATKRLEPGEFGLKVFTEEALIVFPPRGANDDHSGTVPEFLDACPQLFVDWYVYLHKPKSIKAKVLKLYNEMHCSHANALRKYLQNYKKEHGKDICSSGRYILDHIEEFVQFTMVIKFNSVELQPAAQDGKGPGTSFGHGLFETACKMNHSCKPNCVWFTTQDGKSKEVRAVSTICEGEELTVDYNGNLLDATPQRREDILQTRGFLCQCVRCAAGYDDTRRFKCVNPKCTGGHFLVQPIYSDAPRLLNCTSCNAVATTHYTKRVINDEMALVREINELDARADREGIISVTERIHSLEPPHEYHSLAEKCYLLQGELYSVLGDYKSSAEAYAKAVDCRISILGTDYWSQATAFTCEKMGDALTFVNMEEAEKAYRRTFRALELLRGGAQSDPYAKCAMEKLLNVQNCRTHGDSRELPQEDSLKGIANAPQWLPITDFPCQLCGKSSMLSTSSRDTLSYCCEFHRRMHRFAVTKSHSTIC